MKFYDDIDLQKNQLKNVVLEQKTESSEGAEGQIVYDKTDKHAKIYIDTEYKQLALKEDVLEAIANTDFSKFEIVDELPDPQEAKENIFYLHYNIDSAHYDIYAKVNDQLVWIDDTTVDLSAYAKTADVDAALAEKVDKEDGWGLSQENFSYEDELKLASIEEGADVNVIEKVKVNDIELPVTEEDKSVNINITVYSKDSTKYVFARDSKDNGLNIEVITEEGG